MEGRDNPAPTISNLSGLQIGSSWVVTGQVNDTNPGQDTVAITGSVTGNATVYNDGSFDYVVADSGSGSVSAQATDPSGNQSSTASTSIATPSGNAAPNMSLAVSYNQQRSVTLTGKVTDDGNVNGLTVTFSGEVAGTVTTGADGSFSYTANAAALGTISAVTADTLGAASNVPIIKLVSKVPTLTLDAVRTGGPNWKLLGTVSDESPGDLTVVFGGLATGSAQTAFDGTYYGYVTIPMGSHGTVSAKVTDCWGQVSDVEWVLI